MATTRPDEIHDSPFLGRPGEGPDEVMYRRMCTIRRFEEGLLRLFDEGVLNGTTHCAIGQEADAVGVSMHLAPRDHVFTNHRCHGHYLARTGDVDGLLLEIMGKRGGVCGGLGGSQHICRHEVKSNGIQGGIVPAAAGLALARQLDGDGAISAVWIGDGTFGEGAIYEAFNLAALWRLPLWVLVEDNAWAQSTPAANEIAGWPGSLAARLAAFAIPVDEVDTTDVRTVHAAAGTSIAAVRAGGGPRALVMRTYRLCHHSKNDDNRPKDEIEARRAIEPLRIHVPRLDLASRAAIETEVESALAAAVERAKAAP